MNYAEAISSFQKIMLICLQIFLGFQIFTAIVKTSWAVRKINLLELWKYSKERVHDETNLQLLPRLIFSFDVKVFIVVSTWNSQLPLFQQKNKTLREKCPYLEIFWSIFSRIRTVSRISQYSVWMQENTDQKNSEYGHFSCSGTFLVINYSTPVFQTSVSWLLEQLFYNYFHHQEEASLRGSL